MGFGFLLVGYFFSNMMALYSPFAFAKLLGYPLMIYGLKALAPYHKKLEHTYYLCFASLPFALLFAMYALAQFGIFSFWGLFEGVFFEVVKWLYFLFSAVFHIFLLPAIGALASDVALPNLKLAALRNLIFHGLYYLVYLFARLPFLGQISVYFTVPLLFLRCLCLFLTLWLIYGAYRNIAPADEKEGVESDLSLNGGGK